MGILLYNEFLLKLDVLIILQLSVLFFFFGEKTTTSVLGKDMALYVKISLFLFD